MNDNLSKIAGGPTRILSAGQSYVSGQEIYGGGGFPTFKGPMVSRIVVLKEGNILTLDEKFQYPDGTMDVQSVLGDLSSITVDIGQNIDGIDLPAGTILVPTRVGFHRIESGTAMLEIHFMHQQAQTALKVGG